MTAAEQKTREEMLRIVSEDGNMLTVGCGDCATLCQGVHMMPLGWDKHVPAILDAAGL